MLRKETLDRLLVNNRLLQGWMKGDFTAHVEEHNPLKSTAAGTLAWQDVQYGLGNLPLNLKRASVSATGNTFLVDNAAVTIGTSDITVQGTITCAEEGYVLDLDLASARLDLDDALTAIFNDNDTGDSDEDEFWEIPLRGWAAFTAQSLSLAPFTWRPFHALNHCLAGIGEHGHERNRIYHAGDTISGV